jgi:glucan-binding YG repeat protein
MAAGTMRLDGDYYYLGPSDGSMYVGWQKHSDGWRYHDLTSGKAWKGGWKSIKGHWYYLSSTGVMSSGTLKLGSSIYFLGNANDGAMKTGWQKHADGWRYHNGSSGVAIKGWKSYGGYWYYLDASTAVMKTGFQTIGGARYYFGVANDGKMTTGYQLISGKLFFFNSSGVMQTGWKYQSGDWYYFHTSGNAATGWVQLSGKWYYFDPDYWYMYSNEWLNLNKAWYYFTSDGTMKIGWATIGGNRYFFDPSGAAHTGWMHTGEDNWYYFKTFQEGGLYDGGEMVTGWYWIEGKYCYFYSSGIYSGRSQ